MIKVHFIRQHELAVIVFLSFQMKVIFTCKFMHMMTESNRMDLMVFFSVVGRGIVVHAENGGGARLGCGTIKPVASLHIEKTLQHVEAAGFSR